MKSMQGILFLFLFLPAAFSISAKETYPQEDTKLWVNAQAEYEIDDNWEIGFEQELRHYNDVTQLEQSLTDVGATYSISDMFKAGLFYRYRVIPDEDWNRNEVYANFYFVPEIWDFDISNRVRFHTKFLNDKEPIYLLRYRLELAYKLSKLLKPYLSAELFYRLNYDKGDRLTQGRYKAGFDISITDMHSFDLYFMREQEYNSNKIVNSSIFGLGYKFSF